MPQQSDGAAAIEAAAAATSQQILNTIEVDDLDSPVPAAATPAVKEEAAPVVADEAAETVAGGEGAEAQAAGDEVENEAEETQVAEETETAAAETISSAAATTASTGTGTTTPTAAAGTVDVQPSAQEKAAATAANAAQAAQVQQYNAAIQKHNGEWNALQTKIAEGKFDPLDEEDAKTHARLTMERTNLLERRLALQEQQYEQRAQVQQVADDWQQWGKANPGITIAEGQKLLGEEHARLQKAFPGADVRIAAIDAFNTRVQRVVAGKKAAAIQARNKGGAAGGAAGATGAGGKTTAAAKPAVTAPPVTKGAARTPGNGSRVPGQKPKTVLERAAAGEYGDLNKAIEMDD